MKKEIYFCDLCGKEVKKFKDLKHFKVSDGFKDLPQVELCKDCFMEAETKFVELAKSIGLGDEVKDYLDILRKYECQEH